MKEITHYTEESDFPTGLKTAKEISESTTISEEKIISFADRGLMPHWRVDNGEPLFKIGEAKKWLGKNLVTRCNGSDFPVNIKVSPEALDADPDKAPIEIREIQGLKRIPIDDYAPCVYFLCKNNKVVYVGQSTSVANRVTSHKSSKDFDDVYLVHAPKDSLNYIESALIRHLKPKLNGFASGTSKYSAPCFNESMDEELLTNIGVTNYAP